MNKEDEFEKNEQQLVGCIVSVIAVFLFIALLTGLGYLVVDIFRTLFF